MSTPTLMSPIDEVTFRTPDEEEAQLLLDQIAKASEATQAIVFRRILSAFVTKITPASSRAVSAQAALPPDVPKPPSRSNGKNKVNEAPISYASRLTEIDDWADPSILWRHFGLAELMTFLPEEYPSKLEVILSHPNMPPGSVPKSHTAKALAKAIIDRLKKHYGVK